MKTYVLDVRCYVQAENEDELNDVLKNTGISYSEYYGGYNIVDVEENNDVE